MRFALGVFTGGMVLGLAAATPAPASDFDAGRSGIERVQAEAGTSGPGSHVRPRTKAGHKGTQQRPDARRNDEDRDDIDGEEGPRGNPSPDAAEPPGCIYRQEPLGLIV